MKVYVNTLFSMALKKSDLIVVPSKGFLDDFPILKSYSDKILIVPNGVDFNIFSKYYRKKKIFSSYIHGLERYDHVLLFVGNLVEGKGIKTLLDCFELVLKDYPSTSLVIVGTGPLENYIKKKAIKDGYFDNIHLTGFISCPDELVKIYSLSDLFILPSHAEGFPRVILESMMAGTPCLVSNISANYHAVGRGRYGLVAEVSNPLDFADKIKNFFEMTEKSKEKLKKESFEYAKKHSWDDVAKQMMKIYKNLISKHEKRGISQ